MKTREQKQQEFEAKQMFEKEYMDALQVIKNQKLGIMHFYNKDNAQGGMTVIFDNSKSRSNVLEITTAVCSPKDNYDKKVGVLQAMKHFSTGSSILVPLIKGLSKRDVLELLFNVYTEI